MRILRGNASRDPHHEQAVNHGSEVKNQSVKYSEDDEVCQNDLRAALADEKFDVFG